MIILALTCVVSKMAVAAPDHDDVHDQQMSVRELMRLDTALALEKARAQLRQRQGNVVTADQAGSFGQENSLKLLAIYGVGKKLLAEVKIGEKTYVYLRGQAWAVGTRAHPSSYRLEGISGSCVHLARNQETHTLCLHPGLRGRP